VENGRVKDSLAAPTAATKAPPEVGGYASLNAALEASCATVKTGEMISKAFFTPGGIIVRVKGADLQV
jgi:hypothetical protein